MSNDCLTLIQVILGDSVDPDLHIDGSSLSHPNSKKVINTETKEVFHSIRLAAKSIGVKTETLRQRMLKNKSIFKFKI